jgi:serine/threonine-protein kinase
MIRFLRFAVEQAILRREETLKEHLIGIEVFDRKPCYDAGADPIVRVEARRLRTKLSDYYQEQGWNDSVKIDFPLGSYVPVFFWQDGVPSLRVAKGSSSQPCTRRKALAVLPFLNLSPDPDNEYLSDGLTEELINALAKVKGMYVVARTSIFQFKGQACDIRKLGELLSVQSVVEGSVRKAGKQLRITVQLIDVFDGYHLWSEAYTRAMKDIFALQEEISGSIVNALKPRLFSASETPRH